MSSTSDSKRDYNACCVKEQVLGLPAVVCSLTGSHREPRAVIGQPPGNRHRVSGGYVIIRSQTEIYQASQIIK